MPYRKEGRLCIVQGLSHFPLLFSLGGPQHTFKADLPLSANPTSKCFSQPPRRSPSQSLVSKSGQVDSEGHRHFHLVVVRTLLGVRQVRPHETWSLLLRS